MIEKNDWSIQDIWNAQLTFGRKDKALTKRQHIWASEIGRSYYERWLKMNAIKPDFDYDERTLRKFAAGDFFERMVGYVLIIAGILKYDNKWHQIPGTKDILAISVKPDYITGGKPDWEKVEKELFDNPLFKLMPVLERISFALVEQIRKKYPDGLKELVYEIKSINSMLFWAKRGYLSDAYPHHKMQLFAGMKATGLPEGRIFYISKDDLSVAEFSIFIDDDKLNETFDKDVKKMSHYIINGIEPPKPPEIVFDETKSIKFIKNKEKKEIKGCWIPNWQIEWSNYLPTITSCKTKEEWLEKVEKLAKDKNDEIKKEFIKKHYGNI